MNEDEKDRRDLIELAGPGGARMAEWAEWAIGEIENLRAIEAAARVVAADKALFASSTVIELAAALNRSDAS